MNDGIINLDRVLLEVRAKMIQKIVANAAQYETSATNDIKTAITYLNAVDTGEMREASQAAVVVVPDDNTAILIRFISQSDHAIYVIMGVGGNQKYGPRNFLAYAMGLFLARFGSPPVGLVEVGKPRVTPTIHEGEVPIGRLVKKFQRSANAGNRLGQRILKSSKSPNRNYKLT